MLAERGAARLLNVQKHHDVVRVHVKLEVVIDDIVVAEADVGLGCVERPAQIVELGPRDVGRRAPC